jgi:hypothetical protein
MKMSYIFLALIAILIWNALIIKRDQEMFKAYDQVCAEHSQSHSHCRYAK